MFVSIYQLSMSKCLREQMENKSIICTSHYKSIRLTSPPPSIGNLSRFPVSCGLKNFCPPGRDVSLSQELPLGISWSMPQ